MQEQLKLEVQTGAQAGPSMVTSSVVPGRAETGRGALIALNLVLLMVLMSLVLLPVAGAQNSGAPANGRARGEYTMVTGRTTSGVAEAIYILDANNQEVISMKWDNAKQSMVGLGYRSLLSDSKSVPGR